MKKKRNIYFCDFSNFDLLERPLNINIFENNFTHTVFRWNLTRWLPVPAKI